MTRATVMASYNMLLILRAVLAAYLPAIGGPVQGPSADFETCSEAAFAKVG